MCQPPASPLPLWERVDRPQAETGEGFADKLDTKHLIQISIDPI